MNADRSTVIDEAIARLKFDNEQFESGVSQSLSTLDKLKAAVGGAFIGFNVKAFDTIKHSLASLNTKGMEKSVSTISDRFTNLGIVGTTILQEITRKALSLGSSLTHKVLSPINSIWGIITNKGWARATNVKQAEFMIKNLGLSWKKAYDDIEPAVRGTRFGFDEAATAAAQLATSGIKFGEEMPAVLKAIGNAASMANVEYSDMAHIFTTMASNGRVYGEQLQQMSYRGLNATKALADYLGKSEAEVKELVSKGKVSFADFYNSMNKMFGDAAHKANETFSGVLANNKAVFARIGQVYATGFMDASLKVLQHTLPKLQEFEKAIKPIGELASSAMGVVADRLVPLIDRIDFTPITKFIDTYVKPLKEQISGVVAPIQDVQNAVEEAVKPAEDLLELANKVIRGDFGNGKARKDKLEELGYSYELVQNKVNELLGCNFRYEVQAKETAKVESHVAQVTTQHTAALSSMSDVVTNLTRFLGGLQSAWKLVKQAGKAVYDIVIVPFLRYLPTLIGIISKWLGDAGALFSKFADWVERLDPVRKILGGIVGISKMFFSAIATIAGGLANFFATIARYDEPQQFLASIGDNIEFLLRRFSKLHVFAQRTFNQISNLSGVKRLTAILSKQFKLLRNSLIKQIVQIFKGLNFIFNKDSDIDIFSKIGEILIGDGGVIDTVANKLADFAELIGRAGDLVYTAIWGKYGIGTLATTFGDKISDTFKNTDVIPASIKNLFNNSLIQNVKNFGEIVIGFFSGLIDKFKEASKLEGVQKLVAALSNLFEILKGGALDLLAKALEQIDKLLNSNMFKDSEFINFFGEGGVIDTVSGVLATFVEQLQNAPGYIENFIGKLTNLPSKFGDIGEMIQGAIDTFAKFFKEASKGVPNFIEYLFVNMLDPSAAKGAIGTTAKDVLEMLRDRIVSDFISALPIKPEQLKSIGEWIGELFSGALSGSKASLIESASGFGDVLSVLKRLFVENLSAIINPNLLSAFDHFKDSLDSTRGSVDGVVESGQDLSGVLEAIQKYGKPVLDWLAKAASEAGNWSFAEWIGNLTGVANLNILFKIGGLIKAITNDIKDFGTILQNVALVPKEFAGVFTALKDGFSSFGTLAKNWSDVENVFKQWRKKAFTTALRDFAISVALVAGSIALLGSDFVNYDRIRDNADVLLTFVGVLGAFYYVAASTPPTVLDSVANAFVKIGGGLFLLSAAVFLFGKMNPEVLIQGGEAVLIFMTFMAGAAAIAGKANAKGFVGMAAAILLLVPSVWLLGHMDPATLIQGGFAIATFMGAMAGAMKLADTAKPRGFVAIAAALLLLVPSVWLLGTMKFEKLVIGGSAILIFITYMAAAARVAGNVEHSLTAFGGVALAVAAITASLFLLSLMKPSKLIASALALSAVMSALIAAMIVAKSVGDVQTLGLTIGAMVAMLAVISLVLTELASMDNIGSLVAVAVTLGLVIGALTLSLKMLSGLDPAIALKAGLAFDAFAVCIGVLLSLAGALGQLEAVQKAAEGLGKLVGSFFKGMEEANPKRADELNQTADKMSLFSEKIKGFIEMLTSVDETTARAANILASALIKMTAAELIDSLSGFVSKFGKDNSLGGQLESFGVSLKNFLETVKDIDTGDDSKLASIVRAIDFMVEVANKLKPSGGFVQKITGLPDLGDFGKKLSAFADGFNPFNTKVNLMQNVDDGKMEQIGKGAGYMADVAGKLQNSGGKIDWLVGQKNLGDFGAKLAAFANGFDSFNDKVNRLEDIDKEKISKVTSVTEELIKMSGKLKSGDGFVQWVIGQQDLGEFGKKLTKLAAGLVEYSAATAELNTEKMSKVTSLLMYMASFDGMGDIINADTVPMIDAVTRLATSLSAWTQYTSDFNPEQFVTAVGALKKLGEFFAEIDGINVGTADTFGSAMIKLAMTDTAAFCSAFVNAAADAKVAVQIFLEGAAAGLSDPEGNFEHYGVTHATKYGDGVTSMTEGVKGRIIAFVNIILAAILAKNKEFIARGTIAAHSYAKGITDNSGAAKKAASGMADQAVSGLDGVKGKFFDKGNDAAEGFAEGIRDKADDAAREASDMVTNAIEAARRAQDSASPSKITRGLGHDYDDGYALGIDDNAYKASDAVDDMIAATMLTMMGGMQQLSELIDNELETEPVIRPVFDPSGVTYGIGQANAMLSNMNTDVTGGVGAIISNAQNGEAAKKLQLSELDYTGDIARLIENTSTMISAIRENRYAIIDGEYVFDFVDTRMGMA